MSTWLPTLLAGIFGFAAGHYRLKLRMFRNLTPLTSDEHDRLQAIVRAGKARRGDQP